MLNLASSQDLDIILDICDGKLLGTRIGCYCLAYGFDRDFLQVWFDDNFNTVIAKFYDTLTLISDADNCDEIRNFIEMIGYSNLEMSDDVCDKLGYTADTEKKSYIFNGKAENYGAVEIGEEHYKSLYALVSDNIPGSFDSSKEAYLSFLSDFTFRKHRTLARAKGFIVDDTLVSSVITSAETAGYALISAVTSNKKLRGTGLGKKTVLSMINELIDENKKVFVVALNESAEGFYEHLGFEFCGNIATVRR